LSPPTRTCSSTVRTSSRHKSSSDPAARRLYERLPELQNISFRLLGNSTEDLFFPRNYLIVEGASDQEIVSRALELLGVPVPAIKVLSARGVDTVGRTIDSVVRALVPLVVNDSPHAGRVVAMIDKPRDADGENVARLQRDLGDRYFELDEELIEAYVPAAIYDRAGRSRADDLAQLQATGGDYRAQTALKAEISKALTAALTAADLELIPTVRDAAEKAIAASHDAR
jgi:hypothetical protein